MTLIDYLNSRYTYMQNHLIDLKKKVSENDENYYWGQIDFIKDEITKMEADITEVKMQLEITKIYVVVIKAKDDAYYYDIFLTRKQAEQCFQALQSKYKEQKQLSIEKQYIKILKEK